MISVRTALPEGVVLAYTSYLGDRAYARSWMFRQGEDERGFAHIVFLCETDLESIGLGEPLTRGRANLFCDSDLRPHWYCAESETSIIEASFDGGICLRLPDGSLLNLSEPMPDAIAGGHVGQLALLLRVHDVLLQKTCQFKLFSVEAATTFKYSLTLQASGKSGQCYFRSSFEEEITLGDDGWIARINTPKEGIVSRREPLPLPSWKNSRLIRDVPYRRYSPKAAHTFRLEDIEIPGPVVPIGATLTIPRGRGPHPAAIFIGGSGVHDRHGISGRIDLGSHEILDTLSEEGWIGVRFDTRGAGNTKVGSDFLTAGLNTVIEDASAVLAYATQHPEVDSRKVALIGHSQGGLVAMDLSATRSDILALALLATPGRPAEEVLNDQIVNRGEWLGLNEEQIRLQLADFHEFISLVRSNADWNTAQIPERLFYARRARFWYADHLTRNPTEMIARVKCPVLVCQGGKDFQVSVRDARLLEAAALRAGVVCESAIFEDLDHLFKTSTAEPSIADYYKDRPVSSALVTSVITFLSTAASFVG